MGFLSAKYTDVRITTGLKVRLPGLSQAVRVEVEFFAVPNDQNGAPGVQTTLEPYALLLRYTAVQADLQVTAEKYNLVIVPAKAKK